MHTLCMALLWLPDLLKALFEEEWCNLESPAKRMQSLNTKREDFFCILGVLYHLSLLLVKQKKFQIWIHVYLNSPLNWVGYIHLYLYKFVLPRTRMSHGKRQKDYI